MAEAERVLVPSGEAVRQAWALITDPEVGLYCKNAFVTRATRAKLPPEAIAEVSKCMDEGIELLKHDLSSAQPWAGQEVNPSRIKSLRENIARSKVQSIPDWSSDAPKKITVDFAIGNKSQFIRGYPSNDDPHAAESEAACDEVFHDWFAKNNLINHDGILCEMDNKGIKKDAQGNLIRANPEYVKELWHHPENGLVAYMRKAGIELTSQQHPHPDDVAAVTLQAG